MMTLKLGLEIVLIKSLLESTKAEVGIQAPNALAIGRKFS
jgi:hypothetical protein